MGALVRELQAGKVVLGLGLCSCRTACSIRKAGEAAGVLSPVCPVGRWHETGVTS